MLEIPLKDGSTYKIPWQLHCHFNELYFNFDEQLEIMRLWLIANPRKQKTSGGMPRFFYNWMQKSGKLRPRQIPQAILEARERPITPEDRERNKGRIAELKAVLRR